MAKPAAARRKAGRPPRISKAMIAEAAHDLGLDGLTLKAVADHLGVSVAALYHHVSGKEELMRMAAERSTRAVPLPVDNGQSWAQWLRDWANYNRAVFSMQPGLLSQYIDGAITPAVVVENLDTILGVLVREGFSIAQANAAYGLVSSYVLGTVVGASWEHAVGGRASYQRALARRGKDQLPHVRALLASKDAEDEASFERQLETVLRGIATRFKLRWRGF